MPSRPRRIAVRPIQTVAVFGSSAAAQDSALAKEAETLGRLLAEDDLAVVCGGYGGVMEAVCRGVAGAGGTSLGVTCDAFIGRAPNPHISREVRTIDLPTRISTLLRMAHASIVLDGGIGTLAELLLAWNLLLTGSPKPVVVVGERLRLAIDGLGEYTEIAPDHVGQLRFVETVEAAAACIARLSRNEDS